MKFKPFFYFGKSKCELVKVIIGYIAYKEECVKQNSVTNGEVKWGHGLIIA